MVLFYFRSGKLFNVTILVTIQAIEHPNGINMLSLVLVTKTLFRSKMSFYIIPIRTILPARLLHPLQEFLFQTNTTELLSGVLPGISLHNLLFWTRPYILTSWAFTFNTGFQFL